MVVGFAKTSTSQERALLQQLHSYIDDAEERAAAVQQQLQSYIDYQL